MKKDFINLIKNSLIFFSFFIGPSIVYSILFEILAFTNISEDNIYLIFLANFLYMMFIFFIYRKTLITDFKDFIKNKEKIIPKAIKFWLIGLAVMILSNTIISFIIPSGPTNENEVQALLQLYPVYMIFSTCIYAPFIEELIFRKNIKDFFHSNTFYIIFSGFIFGLIHAISGLGNNFLEILYVIPYGALGLVFAYLYQDTKNIFSTIFVHLLHNAILVLLALL